MKEYLSTCFTLLLMIVCLPFLATFLISGQESCPLYKPLDMEKYLPVIVYLQIPYTHHLENIKAQTVIARTNIQRQLEKGASLYEILEEPLDYLVHEQSVFHFLRTYEQFVKAAGATRGQILTYQNQELRCFTVMHMNIWFLWILLRIRNQKIISPALISRMWIIMSRWKSYPAINMGMYSF